MFADPQSSSAARSPQVDDGWSILLARLPQNADELSKSILDRVRTRDGIRDARIAQRSGQQVIVTGSFDSAEDPQAQRELARIQSIQADGRRPYASATLMPPPPESMMGSVPEHDLRTVKARYGSRAVFTLQIGVYGTLDDEPPSREERREFRIAAEQAVQDLREQGERAFYYHAPNMSVVTVGIFNESDFDGTTRPPIESARLKQLRQKYPHNLLNGQGIRQTVTADTGQRVTRMQESRLVGIPDAE